MQPDCRAAGSGPQPDQVAELVDDPQPVTVGRIRGGTAAAGQRVADAAGVLDLADDLSRAGPHVQDAIGTGVAQGVSGQLMNRGHQVGEPAGGKPGLARVLPGERPYLGEAVPVGERRGVTGRGRQGLIALVREQGSSGVAGAAARVPVPDDDRVGLLRVRDDARA
jgi:hypothetical protein